MPFRVVVVCLANVCRSPLGERLLRLRLDELGAGDAYAVDSAGTRALVGSDMAEQSRAELEARGGDGAGFASTQLGRQHRDAGLVLCATRKLRGKVLEEHPGLLRRAFTVRELAELLTGLEDDPALQAAGSPEELVRVCASRRSALRQTDHESDVPDPMGHGDEVYAEVAVMLDDALSVVARHLARVADHGTVED